MTVTLRLELQRGKVECVMYQVPADSHSGAGGVNSSRALESDMIAMDGYTQDLDTAVSMHLEKLQALV